MAKARLLPPRGTCRCGPIGLGCIGWSAAGHPDARSNRSMKVWWSGISVRGLSRPGRPEVVVQHRAPQPVEGALERSEGQ